MKNKLASTQLSVFYFVIADQDWEHWDNCRWPGKLLLTRWCDLCLSSHMTGCRHMHTDTAYGQCTECTWPSSVVKKKKGQHRRQREREKIDCTDCWNGNNTEPYTRFCQAEVSLVPQSHQRHDEHKSSRSAEEMPGAEQIRMNERLSPHD